MKGILIFLAVVILIGIAYYFIVYKKSAPSAATGIPSGSGTSPHITGIVPTEAGNSVIGNQIITNQASNFNKGDNVYINNSYNSDNVYVYTYPKADGLYLIGDSRHSWWGAQPIGKFVEMAGANWAKITVSGFQIYQYPSNNITKISQDVFVPIAEIATQPY